MKKIKIFIADDDKNIQFAFKRLFEEEIYHVISLNNGLEVLESVNKEQPDLIFMDITMPKRNGLEVLKVLREKSFKIPVVIITGFSTMQNTIQAIQLGAYEYITKPLDIDKILIVAKRALEMVNLREKLEKLNTEIIGKTSKDEIIGNHPKMLEVYKTIGSISTTPNSTNVLITGESGTGKELVARAIHKSSGGADHPFVALNCSVFPENLLESELFGYEKGAFTDAQERRAGKFEVAKTGTIFLDEIGDMSINIQQKLLRVLQEREFYRVGGHELLPVGARFIAATNKNLKEAIRGKRFRHDLYYRLNVINIRLPELWERGDDISLLLHYFIRKYSTKLGKKIISVMPEVIDFLNNYKFPGNVRELENFVERAIIFTNDNVLRLSAFPIQKNYKSSYNFEMQSLILEDERKIHNDLFEKNFMQELMKKSGGKINLASQMAKVDRRTISRLLQKHRIIAKTYK